MNRGLFALLLLAMCAMADGVAAFQFTPIVETLRPSGRDRVKKFRAINEGADPIAVEIKIMKRDADANGDDKLSEVDESLFAIFPLQTIIMPGNSKEVRVEWLGARDLTDEGAYRIIAEQVPVDLEKRSGGKGAHVQVMLRYVGSLYVQPEKAKSVVAVTDVRVGLSAKEKKSMLRVTVENTGTRHTLLRDATLKLSDTLILTGAALTGLLNFNVLAHTKRTFDVAIPAGVGSGFVATNPVLTYRESD